MAHVTSFVSETGLPPSLLWCETATFDPNGSSVDQERATGRKEVTLRSEQVKTMVEKFGAERSKVGHSGREDGGRRERHSAPAWPELGLRDRTWFLGRQWAPLVASYNPKKAAGGSETDHFV